MKKLIVFLFLIFQIFNVNAQIDKDDLKNNPAYLKFLPSDVNPQDLRPSDIPSEQVLKQMGLSEFEIKEALNYKNSNGKYLPSNKDTSIIKSNLEKFYLSFGDSLKTDTVKYPKARIYGQDIFRNNKLSFYQKALDAKAPENYKVGSGDEISISVWGYSEYAENLLVDERGYINPSSYGRIYVKGLTFKNMRSLLKKRFSTALDMKNSEIDITLSYSRVITVNIVGEVYNPGSYQIPAHNTAFNALIAAKGPSQLGSVRNIYIKRDGKTIDSLDVYQFLFNPKKTQDIFMQDGDYLFIPPANNIIEVNGAVNRPYTYEAKNGETVADLINYAGGTTINAFSDVITLKSIDYNTIKVHDVYKDHINSTSVKNGDEIYVNSISNKLSNYVSIKGNIGVSGDYEFIAGEYLTDLLYRAKCIDDKTFLNKVYIIRTNDDNTKSHISVNLKEILEDKSSSQNILLKEYDIIRVLSTDDFIDEYSIKVHGAVRSPGEFEYGNGMSLRDALLQSGGLMQSSQSDRIEISRIMDYDVSNNKLIPIRTIVKRIKVTEDLMLDNNKDFLLQPFDQIFVRKNPDYEEPVNVVILGEVNFPGKYTLVNKNEQVSSLVKRAGGLTNDAFVDGVKMYRRFKSNIVKQEKIHMPENLLDSILTNVELQNIYNQELLRISENKNQLYSFDSLMYDMVYFNMERALSKKQSRHNLVLKEGDSIIVPKKLDIVHVTGDLSNIEGNSISSPFFIGKRADYYVNNFAGGYSKENKRSNTIVVHANGSTQKSINLGLFSVSPKVKPGSTIKVVNDKNIKRKKKEDIDYNKHIESVIIKITGIMSLYLLIERLNNSF